jgi:polysaccharide biosynthesis transport protein
MHRQQALHRATFATPVRHTLATGTHLALEKRGGRTAETPMLGKVFAHVCAPSNSRSLPTTTAKRRGLFLQTGGCARSMLTLPMTLTQLLRIFRARWLSALLVLATVLTAVVAATLATPKHYTAAASVVLDVKSPDPIAGMVLPGMNASGYMATQVDVMRSERVALRAMQALSLDRNPEYRADWQRSTGGRGNYLSWLAESVLNDLEVRPARDSNVITVAYTSDDPVVAANVANAFVRAFTDTTLELRVEPAKLYNSFFDERSKDLRDALEASQARLSAYQRSRGIIVTDERLDIENSRLSELSSQLVALQAVAEESGSRQQQAAVNAVQMPEVLGSPLLAGLVAELSRQEGKLNEVKERLGDRHPEVLQLQAGADTLRTRIDAETRRVTGSIKVSNNVNQARMAQLKIALDQQRARMLNLKSQREDAGVLQRDVENAQKAYDANFARVSQTTTESQNTQTNVSVLKEASPPAFASSPRLRLNLAAGAALGLLLAMGVAVVRELLDQRLRSSEDVLLLLRQPLLGVLPARPRIGLPGRSRGRLTRLRLMAALPRPPRGAAK